MPGGQPVNPSVKVTVTAWEAGLKLLLASSSAYTPAADMAAEGGVRKPYPR